MKINFNYIPQIKNNFANKSNLRFNSSLVTDVFERKNVSFGKRSEQSPKEILIQHKGFSESQADVILSIGNIGLANEIVSLMKNGYDFNSAIDEVVKNNYLFNADDFAKYQNLSAISELDIIDRVAVVAYELNDEQLERYKVNKDKFTQPYEAILAVKFDLSDEEITQYLSKKNTCALPPDELMICIKEKFNDSQLARFTELKNRKKSFENQTVRKQEEQQVYPINYIIACIKEGKSDEDIGREDRIVELAKTHYNTAFKMELILLNDEQYGCFKEYVNDQIPEKLALMFAQLNKKQMNIFGQYLDQGIEPAIAYQLAKLKPEEVVRYFQLVKNGKDKSSALSLCKLTEDQYDKYNEHLKSNGKTLAMGMAQLSEQQCLVFDILVNPMGSKNPIPMSYIGTYLMPDIFGKIKGYSKSDALCFAQLTPEQSLKAQAIKSIKERQPYKLEIGQNGEFKTVFVKYNSQPKFFDGLLDSNLRETYAMVAEKLKCNSDIIDFVSLNDDKTRQYLALLQNQKRITHKQIMLFIKNTSLTSLSPVILEKLPDDFWYKINTGSEKEVHEIIQKAIVELLLEQRGEGKSLNLTPVGALPNFKIPKQGGKRNPRNFDTSDYDYNKTTGDFILKKAYDYDFETGSYTQKNTDGKPVFQINLSQSLINQKPILVIKDKSSNNRYVSCNGAIAKVKPIQNHDSFQFETWGNILPQKQAEVLAKAANEFVFNLFNENGNCIIGQNASDLNTAIAKDEEIEDFYSDKLLALKENNSLNAQEILKLMPKNCMLTISPYIQEADFSYAIVCEWFSADNTRWQMEIHSQDSKWNNDEQWSFRLHKQTKFGRQYFQFANNKNGFNFDADTFDENAHIKIPTPLEENDLLNNVEFQTIINQISAQQYKDFEIDKIAKDLKAGGQNNEEKIQNIINHCLTHPLDFARYKDVVLKLRATLGMIELV